LKWRWRGFVIHAIILLTVILVILDSDPTDKLPMDELTFNKHEYNRLLHNQQERLKELACINKTTSILKEGKPIEESLQQIVLLLPAAWQYPEYTVARIKFMGKEFETIDFRETNWRMVQEFITIDDEKGSIEIFYTTEFNTENEGPFLKEERDLIQNIGSLLTGYINSYKARDIIRLTQVIQQETASEISRSS
jgi:hypothetical protein